LWRPARGFQDVLDSEDEVGTGSAWVHVKNRLGDKWDKPANAAEDDLHFMVRSMEAWLLADPETISEFYGKDFQRGKLPKNKNVAAIDRHSAVNALEAASAGTQKGSYGKGSHSFDLLSRIDTTKVMREPWAKRFFDEISKRMST
jgi:hypothetical protein